MEKLYNVAVKTDAQMIISGYTMEYFENGTSHSYSVSTPEYNYKTQSVVRNNLHNYLII